MMRLTLVLVLILVFFKANSQDTASFELSGKFYESNIYIYNPKTTDGFSIFMLVVNNDTIFDELNSNSVEIDFQLLGLRETDNVSILVFYDSAYIPFVVNPEVLYSPQKLKISTPKIKGEELSFRISGEIGDFPLEVQQFRWNSWRVIAQVDPLDTVENNLYQVAVKTLHSGQNTFKIKGVNLQEEVVFSKEAKYKPPYIEPILIKSVKFVDEIEFSAETSYEIYDEYGALMLSGIERYVNISKLGKGVYWLNFDNESVQFKKK